MDLKKVLWHGISAFLYVLLAAVLTVIIGALGLALGYKPEGAMNQVIWIYFVLPFVSGIIGALDNWRRHLDSSTTPK